MANKEKIEDLLADIRELETRVAGMQDAEVYPASFFGQTFDLTHKILDELHVLESAQLDLLRKQMEEHEALLQSIPRSVIPPARIPERPEPEVQPREGEDVRPGEQAKPLEQAKLEEQPQANPEIKEISQVVSPEPKVISEPTTTPVSQRTISTEKSGLFLNDLLEKKNLSDFRKAFSLNDRFRFRRELFGGNEEKMNKTIADLNEIHTYEEAITYLDTQLQWNVEDVAVADFIQLLEKRYL